MFEQNSLISIFWNQTNTAEKKLLFSISLMYSFFCSGISGMALWFLSPTFLCFKDGKSFLCSENDICSIDSFEILGTVSLLRELDLFCDRRYIKRILLSLIFFGGFLGCFVNMSIYVPARLRKKVLSLLGLLFASASFGIIMFSKDESLVGCCLILISFSVMIGNSYCFMIINEYFSGEVAKLGVIMITMICGIYGIIFVAYAYFINGYWLGLFAAMTIMMPINSIYLLLFTGGVDVKEALSKMPTSQFQFFKELINQPMIAKNFFIFVLVWTCTSITYNDVLIELETLGGNTYLNLGLISSAEILASFLAGLISVHYNVGKLIKIFNLGLMAFFSLFLLAPSKEEMNKNIYLPYILFGLLLCGKLLSETVCNLVYIYVPKILTDKFTGFFMVFVRLFSRICLLFLPYINHMFKSYQLHSFVFLFIVWTMSRFFLFFAQEVCKEGIDDYFNEYKINITDRMSVFMSGKNLHQPIDEVIRNLRVDSGHSFSMIILRRKTSNDFELHKLKKSYSVFHERTLNEKLVI